MPQLRAVVCYEQPADTDRLGSDYHHQGRMQLSAVVDDDNREGEFFLCGPLGFMQQQWQGLLSAGVPPTRIHREVFGPELLDHLV